MSVLKTTPDQTIAAARAASADQGRSIEAAIRAQLLEHAIAGGVLGDFTLEEQKYLDYAVLCRLRRAAYETIVAAMDTPQALVDWAAAMTANLGPTCIVHAHELSWPAALRVVRWGEEPSAWPATWEEGDLQRAASWLGGDHPSFTTYLIGPDRKPVTPRPGARFTIG